MESSTLNLYSEPGDKWKNVFPDDKKFNWQIPNNKFFPLEHNQLHEIIKILLMNDITQYAFQTNCNGYLKVINDVQEEWMQRRLNKNEST